MKIENLKILVMETGGIEKIDLFNTNIDRFIKTDINQAIELAKDIENLSSELGYKKGSADIWNNQGKLYCIKAQYDKAMEYFRKAEGICLEMDYKAGLAASYYGIGHVYDMQSEYESSMIYLRKAYTAANNTGNDWLMSNALNDIGKLYYLRNNYAKSIEYLEQALRLREESNDLLSIAKSYNNLGNVYKNISMFEECLDYYLKALKIFESLNEKNSVSNVYTNIASVHLYMKHIEKAKKYLDKAIELKKETGNTLYLGLIYKNYGSALSLLNHDDAMTYFTLSLAENKRTGNKMWIADTLTNIGQEYQRKDEIEKAEVYYSKALKVFEKLGNTNLIGSIYAKLASLYRTKGEYEKSINYALKSLELLDDKGQDNILADIHLSLSKSYENISDYKKALQHYKLSMDFQAIITDLSKAKLLAEMEAKYTLEKSEQEKELAESRAENYRLRGIEMSGIIDRLNESNAAKNKIFSIVSHDLKNPFQALQLASLYLQENYNSLKDNDKKQYINDINDSVKRINRLMNNLLDWARTQMDSIVFTPGKVNLAKLIEKNLDLLEPAIREKMIRIRTSIQDNMSITADQHMLDTIIRNILSNAVKFTHYNGKIEVSVKKDDDKCSISISDTGIGISESEISRIFDIGIDKSRRGTAREKGTGLGLAICKDFVEKHGGTINVKSSPCNGSEFEIIIPVCEEEDV